MDYIAESYNEEKRQFLHSIGFDLDQKDERFQKKQLLIRLEDFASTPFDTKHSYQTNYSNYLSLYELEHSFSPKTNHDAWDDVVIDSIIVAYPLFMAVFLKEYDLAIRLIAQGYHALEELQNGGITPFLGNWRVFKSTLFPCTLTNAPQNIFAIRISQLLVTDCDMPSDLIIRLKDCLSDYLMLSESIDFYGNPFFNEHLESYSPQHEYMGFTCSQSNYPDVRNMFHLYEIAPELFNSYTRTISMSEISNGQKETELLKILRYYEFLIYIHKTNFEMLSQLANSLRLPSFFATDDLDFTNLKKWFSFLQKIKLAFMKSPELRKDYCILLAHNYCQVISNCNDRDIPWEKSANIPEAKIAKRKLRKTAEHYFIEMLQAMKQNNDFLNFEILSPIVLDYSSESVIKLMRAFKKATQESLLLNADAAETKTLLSNVCLATDVPFTDKEFILKTVLMFFDEIDGFYSDSYAKSQKDITKKSFVNRYEFIFSFDSEDLLLSAINKHYFCEEEIPLLKIRALLMHQYRLIPMLNAYI